MLKQCEVPILVMGIGATLIFTFGKLAAAQSSEHTGGLNKKAVALRAPAPEYPYEARRLRITGSGVALLGRSGFRQSDEGRNGAEYRLLHPGPGGAICF